MTRLVFVLMLLLISSPVFADSVAEARALADLVAGRLKSGLDSTYQITETCDGDDCSIIVE